MNPKINYINRAIEPKLIDSFNKGKIITLYGARQAGKTTLVKNIFDILKLNYLYLSCEEQRIKEKLVPDFLSLKKIIGDYKYIILDEAQKVDNPGLILKILIDNDLSLNIIASGSSSFDLANKINEPLTGRHFQFTLYPFSYSEIAKISKPTDLDFLFKESLIFGSYPNIYKQASDIDKINTLSILTSDYLYRDLINFGLVKNSQKIHDLLIALALQIGNEVSYNELGNLLRMDYKTVERYIDLLEKCFVIFRLRAFNRNRRSELNRKVKIYFYDLGVRNSLLNNFSPLNLRNDGGAIFENYFVSEKIKSYQIQSRTPNVYFWRTYTQKEIDFIEEIDGKIIAYEVKMDKKAKISRSILKEFNKEYGVEEIKVITPDNFMNYL